MVSKAAQLTSKLSARTAQRPLLLVSTKTGDQGLTSLVTGDRLPKSHQIFEVVGTLDELNSWLGYVVATFQEVFSKELRLKKHQVFLLNVQNLLFVIGAEVAGSPKTKLTSAQITALEKNAREIQEKLTEGWHSKFVLPGGTIAGARLDLARTVCRRAERSLVTLAAQQKVRPLLLQYLNRLSDYLYVLRCMVNYIQIYQEQYFEQNKKVR